MFIIAAPSLSNATARLGTDAEAALKEQYLHLAGKVPDNWTKMSEALQTVGGIKCLVVLWKMPPIQGTVLIQKHACMIHDGRAFFLSATGDANKWSQLDAEVISPLFDSFRVSPPNPAAPSHQSNKQNDKTGKSTTGDNSGGMGIGGGILIAVITYIFLRVAILRK
jgi:hypothetical protein